MFMCSIGPHSRRNSHQVVRKVIENINVLPVVEGIWSLCMCSLDEPEQQKKATRHCYMAVTAATARQRTHISMNNNCNN